MIAKSRAWQKMPWGHSPIRQNVFPDRKRGWIEGSPARILP